MEKMIIPADDEFPEIDFNAQTGNLSIKGSFYSFSGINDRFFKLLLDWTKGYALTAQEQTTMNIQLDYFGTEVSKLLLYIFYNLRDIHNTGKHVCINWYYDESNIDILEIGQEYKSMLNFPFNLIKINK